MEPYANYGGDSGIIAYDTGPDYIRVEFSDHSIYRYTYRATGRENVEHMKGLASSGHGLHSFINKAVRKSYDRKEC